MYISILTNAFNAVNRMVMLYNVQRQCPAINMYRAPSRLFVCGTEIPSAEGTTQGDNLAMPLFALATFPILQKLKELRKVMQVWLADDASSVGTLKDLKTWWNMIVAEGIKYGPK